MFRIERNLVKVGDVRLMRTVQVDVGRKESSKRVGVNESDESKEAGVAGDSPDAAASETTAPHEILSNAQTEAETKAQDLLSRAEAEANSKACEILKKAEAKATGEAGIIIEDARKEAEAVMQSAREQAEDEREQARKEGYAEGAEEGKRSYDELLDGKMRELENEFGEKIREDDETLKRTIAELYDERTRTYESLEEHVVGLALEIVKKVLDPSEDEFGGVFEMLIKNALKQINPDKKIIIRVGPTEFERFFPSGSASFEMDRGVTITASVLRDASLEAGDCIIDTEGETLNVGLDSQLKYIELAFAKADSV